VSIPLSFFVGGDRSLTQNPVALLSKNYFTHPQGVTAATFDLVELHALKWFNFSMRPTRSRTLGDGYRRDRVNRRVVERHMAVSGVTAIDPEVRPGPVGFQS
jgi:hypothetical protein